MGLGTHLEAVQPTKRAFALESSGHIRMYVPPHYVCEFKKVIFLSLKYFNYKSSRTQPILAEMPTCQVFPASNPELGVTQVATGGLPGALLAPQLGV